MAHLLRQVSQFFILSMKNRSTCHENKICGVRHFSAVTNKETAINRLTPDYFHHPL
jgi:hypothetical protein